MPSLLEIIPGYAEAVWRESFLRDAAFLGVTETVAGFELKPMTLRHYIILRIARNPIIFGGLPDPVQLAQFLWTCSAEYSTNEKARKRFLKRCRHLTEGEAFRGAVAQARAYAEEAGMDRPPRNEGRGFTPDYYSEIVWWIALFQFSYTPDQILDMPMKVLWQFRNFKVDESNAASGRKTPLFNPSDKVRAEWSAQSN